MPEHCYVFLLAAKRRLFGGKMSHETLYLVPALEDTVLLGFKSFSFMPLYLQQNSMCRPVAHRLALVSLK